VQNNDITDAVNLTGKFAVVAVDFHNARIYAIDAATHSAPERIAAADPRHMNHNVFHRHGNPSGAFDVDRGEASDYLKKLAHALAPAEKILLLGHGKGKANASHLLESYLEKHHRNVAAKIVANVRVDIDDITNNQLLRFGEMYFGMDEPVRRPNEHSPAAMRIASWQASSLVPI